ncbi:MAG: response regulator [Spirochaetales bacterium]|nr:response regulator [Spirochaetales bacterium]
MYKQKHLLKWNDVELKLSEDAIIMQTTLDILAHDTKNLFTNIFALLVDLPSTGVANSLTKHINELYNLVAEALGYISFEKRIFSLVEMINSISLEKERIPLSEHPRIKFNYTSRKLFFVETGRVFKNVLCNVIENALKYSDSKTNVIIQLQRLQDDIEIKIMDNGMGIPDEEKDKVFQRSYRAQTAKHIEGSGMGLWIVQNIINKEGGDIKLLDNPEGGTIVAITIPAFQISNLKQGFHMLEEWYGLSIDEVKKKAMILREIINMEYAKAGVDIDSLVFANLLDQLRGENVQQQNGRVWVKLNTLKLKNPSAKSILLVDDSLYVHYKMAPLLIKQGWRIAGYALDGRKAVKLYKEVRPDLVIIDITMPIMSGIEAARKIIELNSKAKFIFSTALGDDKVLLDELKENFLAENYLVITKPFKHEELIRTVEEIDN